MPWRRLFAGAGAAFWPAAVQCSLRIRTNRTNLCGGRPGASEPAADRRKLGLPGASCIWSAGAHSGSYPAHDAHYGRIRQLRIPAGQTPGKKRRQKTGKTACIPLHSMLYWHSVTVSHVYQTIKRWKTWNRGSTQITIRPRSFATAVMNL